MADQTETVTNPDQDKSSWKEWPFLLIKGFLMGSADIVPGVSGGTMALIVGIYTRLINAIKSFDGTFFKQLFSLKWQRAWKGVHWKFMAMLLSGIAIAIIFFTRIVPLQVYMFTDPELIYGLFFGLIVGSIYILVKALNNFDWMVAVMIGLGTIIGYWVVTLVPTDTPESAWYIFFSGSVAICAMILPGISGSYILLILQKYDFILSELGKIGTSDTLASLITLLPFVAGAIVGLAVFSRILSWLLSRYEARTLAVLIGFLIGSLYVIWPYQDREYTEIVTSRQVIEYDSEKAEALRRNPPDEQRPEFQRLGEVIDASSGELKKIELLTVKKKLISSDPYVPYVTEEGPKSEHFRSGIVGMLLGLVMVVGLDYLRDRK